jgi:hypothetical protein
VKITELLDKEPLVILLFFLLGAAADVWKKGTYMDTPMKTFKVYRIQNLRYQYRKEGENRISS